MIAGSPKEYAARMWRSCTGSPFAPAEKKLLSPEVLQSLRPRFLEAATRHAAACALPGGIADPFVMMYVVASTQSDL
jgi:hypothetical protein